MKVSEPMQRLRDALSARRISWEDKSDYMDCGDAGIHVIERTQFRSDTETITAIYGYTEDSGVRYGITYGYPDMVEIIRPMTPEEILDCIITA